MSLFQFLNITNSGNEGNGFDHDHDHVVVRRAATDSYRSKNRKNDKFSLNRFSSNNHGQPKQQPPLARLPLAIDDEIMVRNSLNAIFDRHHFSLLLQDFLHRIGQSQNCSQHQGSRMAEPPSLLSLDFVLKKLFFNDHGEHVDGMGNQNENYGSDLLMLRLKSIDQDVRRFLEKVHEKTRKDDRRAEQCLLQAEKFDAKKSLGYVINFVNQALIFGSDPMIRRALIKRAMVHFDNNDLVNSIQDLLIIMSHWGDDCDDIDLIKIGAISFYILAKHSIQKSDGPGSKYALINLDRAEQLFEKLKIHARMDRNADRQLQYVYRRLKITNTDGFLQELREHLQCIDRLDDSAMKNQEQQQQKPMLTNIFLNDKLEPIGTDGSIMARSRIEANEKLFFETMLTMLIENRDHRHQYCANCYRQIAHGYHPCEYCTEVVFCDVYCRRLSRKHRKTCRFSSIMLMDSTQNNHQMALCYELFASLPIEQIVGCFEKFRSASDDDDDAMDPDLDHPDQFKYSMFSFYNLLSSYKTDMHEIHLLNTDHQKRLINALQLGLLMKNQFKLTKSDLNLDDTEKPIDIVDLFHLIGPIFATLLSLERCALVEKPRFFLRKYPKFNDDYNEHEKPLMIGRGIGTFELRIKLTERIERANVRRRFANNGKLEFISTKPIEPGEMLFMLLDQPPLNSLDGNTAQDIDGKEQIQQGYSNRFEPYMQTLW